MKTRIIQTRFWDDDQVQKVSPLARYLWIFLITNKELGMSNYNKIPDIFIQYYTGLNTEEIKRCKKELEKTKKLFFKDDWVYIRKLEDHNKYQNSPKNFPTYLKELSVVPSDIEEYFKKKDSSIDSSRHSNHKSKIRNKKSEIQNKKSKEEVLGEDIKYEF
jgi:hypothetical protein